MIGVILFTVITFVISVLLVFLNNFLEENEKEEKILKALPGYNCGSCGFGSCKGMANMLIKDKDAINKCRFIKNKEEIHKIIEKD